MDSDNSKKGRVRISQNVLLYNSRKKITKIITISFFSVLGIDLSFAAVQGTFIIEKQPSICKNRKICGIFNFP